MKKTLLILIVAAIFLISVSESTMIPHIGKAKGKVPPRFKLDLDLPPRKRWVEIAKSYQIYLEEVLVVVDYFVNLLPGKLKEFFLAVDVWAQTGFKYREMMQEIQGISDATRLPFSKLFFLNFMYDFSSLKLCSSILVRNINGTILHGRNLDFELFDRFSRLAAIIDVYKGGKLIYTMDSFVGAVFGLTAMKQGAFSITVDTRKDDSATITRIFDNLVKNNYIPSTWLIRKVLEEESSWESAVKRLNTTVITSPIYYIIAGVGPNEGAVIERQYDKPHGYYQLDEKTWFLVQTNYDRDIPDPKKDERRTPAEKRLNELGQKITIDDLFEKVMLKYPTFNVASIITFSGIPATGYNNLTAWYGINEIKPYENSTIFE